jgi:hypothetical protein
MSCLKTQTLLVVKKHHLLCEFVLYFVYFICCFGGCKLLWHVDSLLGSDREIDDCKVAVARLQPENNNRGMVFSARFTTQQLNSNGGTVFSLWSVPGCYKQDSWSNEWVMRQSPVGGNMSMEAEDSVGIHHQAMTGEDTADWEDLVLAVGNCRVCELAIVL